MSPAALCPRCAPPAQPGRARAPAPEPAPDVAVLLALDAEFRGRAGMGLLQRIVPPYPTPRRYWRPVWHTERGGWRFTVLYSNSELALRYGATRDWVILQYRRHGHHGQCTVVTEWHRTGRGRRVVRGREKECSRYRARARRLDADTSWMDQIETG